jgi:hypothetical protein
MGLWSEIKGAGEKVVSGVKKVASGVAKGVKKAVKGVTKVVREVGRGVKKLAKNKYVQMGLLIAAAVTLPMFVPAISGLGAVAAGAVTGAITGAGGALLQGGDFKDVLKGAAFGSATGAAFAKIGEAVKTAQAARAGGEGLDLTQGKLDAMGADLAEVPATAVDVATPSVDVTSPLDITSPLDVSSQITEAVTPQGGLVNISTSGNFEAPIFMDEVGNQFTADAFGNFTAIPSSPTPTGITASDLITKPSLSDINLGDSFKIDSNVIGSETTTSLANNITLPKVDTTVPPTFGEQVASRLKETFSPENVIDKTFEIGGDLAYGALQAASDKALYGENQAVTSGMIDTAENVGSSSLQQFRIAMEGLSINPNDATAHMTFGPANPYAMQGELFSQQTVQVT